MTRSVATWPHQLLGLLFVMICTIAVCSAARRVPPPPVTPSPRNRDRMKYNTEYACEGKTLNISCAENYVIHLVRANYGRLSVSICNPQAKIDMSVNCMSWKSHLIIEKQCMNKRSCYVQVSAKNFDDPCPGTIKYLEVQFNCTLASLAIPSTTTAMPAVLTRSNSTAGSAEDEGASMMMMTTTTTTASSTGGPSLSSTRSPQLSTTLATLPTQHFVDEPLIPEAPVSFPTEESIDPADYDNAGSGGQLSGKLRYCEPRTSRSLHWNWTRAGKVHVQKCPGGATGFARWHCDPVESHWYPPKPDMKQCKSLWVQNLAERLDKESLTQLAADLSLVTLSKELFSSDVKQISTLMQGMLSRLGSSGVDHNIDIWHREQVYKEMLLEFVAIVSNLLEEKHQEAWADLSLTETKEILTRLMTALEENAVLLSDTFTQETNYPVVKNNILMSVRGIESWRNMVIQFPSITERERDQNWSVMQDSILLPIEAIQQFNKQDGLRRLIFIAYNNIDMLLVPEALEERFPSRSTFDDRLSAGGFINSRVVSASIGHQRDIRLAQPLQVTLRHLQDGLTADPQCVYWNTNSESWSSEGCWVVSSNRSHTGCNCDHLGSFAILVEGQPPADGDQKPFDQRLVVTIGCCVALGFCCIAVLLLFLLKLHKSDQLWVHRNLALNLLVAEFIFVVGINQTHLGAVCSAVAAFLQYFLLVTLAWTFFEGFHLYNSIVEPVEIHKSKLRRYASLAYIAPALVTGVSLLIDSGSFGTAKYCWLRSDNYFIFSFIAPMVGIIFGCVVFVCIAVCMICNQGGLATSVKGKEEDKVHAVKSYLYWVTVLLVLMTFTWASAVVYVAKFNITWAIIFAAFNSLLGLFLLLFTCWKNEAFQDRYAHTLANSRWLPNCVKRCLFGGRNQLAIDVSVNSGNGAPLHPHPSWNTDHKAVTGLTAQSLGQMPVVQQQQQLQHQHLHHHLQQQQQQQQSLTMAMAGGKFTIPVRPSMGDRGDSSAAILALTPQTINIGPSNGTMSTGAAAASVGGSSSSCSNNNVLASANDRARSMAAMTSSLSKSQHNLALGAVGLGNAPGGHHHTLGSKQLQGQWVQWRGARAGSAAAAAAAMAGGGPYSEASGVYSAFADHIYESIDVGGGATSSMVPPPAPADSTPNILYGNTADLGLTAAADAYEQQRQPLISKYPLISNQLDATLARMTPSERAATARRAKQIAASTPVVQVNGQLFTPQQLYEVALTQALQVSAKMEEERVVQKQQHQQQQQQQQHQQQHQLLLGQQTSSPHDNQVIAVLDGEKVVSRINPLDSPSGSSNSSTSSSSPSESSPSSGGPSNPQPPRYNLSTYC